MWKILCEEMFFFLENCDMKAYNTGECQTSDFCQVFNLQSDHNFVRHFSHRTQIRLWNSLEGEFDILKTEL